MPTCTGCQLTTNMSYNVASFQGPVTNITSTGPRVQLYSHVVQGVGQGELSGITGFALGWVNIYMDNPGNGACLGMTGQLTLPAVTSGELVTGSSGISYNASAEYCTGATSGCQSNSIYFEFSGNPNAYIAAPNGSIYAQSTTLYQNLNSFYGATVKYHTPSGLSKTNQNITSGNLTDGLFSIDCGGAVRCQLTFDGYVPDVFGSLRATYYYYINCTTCQTGIGGA